MALQQLLDKSQWGVPMQSRTIRVSLALLILGSMLDSASAEEPAAALPDATMAARPLLDCTPKPECTTSGHFTAGAGFYLLSPRWNGNSAFSTTQTQTTAVAGSAIAGFNNVSHQPAFFVNPAFVGVTDAEQTPVSATPVSVVSGSSSGTDFDYGVSFAPRVWLGYVTSSGLGAQISWWEFDQGSSRSAAAIASADPAATQTIFSSANAGGLSFSTAFAGISAPVGADSLFFDSKLRMNVGDLEATYAMELGRFAAQVGGGLRYAHIFQEYQAFRSNTGGTFVSPPLVTAAIGSSQFMLPGMGLNTTITNNTTVFGPASDSIQFSHRFDGLGPTVSADGRYRIGSWGLALYGDSRAAFLFGESKVSGFQDSVRVSQTTTTSVTGNVGGTNTQIATISTAFPTSTSTVTQALTSRHDHFVPVGELEIGAEYGHGMGPTWAFVRIGLVGQAWWNAGNSSSEAGDLGLLGMTLTGGLNY